MTDPNPIDKQLAYFHEQVLPTNHVHLAWLGGVLAGFIACNQESVSQLHVRVGLHRQGIGTKMLSLAKSESAGSLWLFTFKQNVVARQFYEHHRFRSVLFGFEPIWQLEDVKYQWLRGENAA